MPHILSDPPVSLVVIVVLTLTAAAAVWWRNRSKKSVIAFVIVGVLAVVFFGLSWWFESPREKAIHRVNAVIEAMNRYDAGSAMTHVSDRFDYRGAKKSDLKHAQLNQILRQYKAKIQPWGFDRSRVEYDGERCTIDFSVNVTGDLGSRPGFYVRATVDKDPDGEHRLIGFKVYENTMQGTNASEFVVPGLGK